MVSYSSIRRVIIRNQAVTTIEHLTAERQKCDGEQPTPEPVSGMADCRYALAETARMEAEPITAGSQRSHAAIIHTAERNSNQPY
jgi:hypothetical protein